jgi:hypothetical protein
MDAASEDRRHERRGGGITIDVELDANYSLQEAYDAFVTLGKEVERVGPSIGLEDFWSFFRDRGGSMNVYLSHRDPDKTKAAVKALKEALPRIPGAKVQIGLEDRDGDSKQRTSFQVFGPNLDKLEAVARDVAEEIARMPGVLETKCDLEHRRRRNPRRPEPSPTPTLRDFLRSVDRNDRLRRSRLPSRRTRVGGSRDPAHHSVRGRRHAASLRTQGNAAVRARGRPRPDERRGGSRRDARLRRNPP